MRLVLRSDALKAHGDEKFIWPAVSKYRGSVVRIGKMCISTCPLIKVMSLVSYMAIKINVDASCEL